MLQRYNELTEKDSFFLVVPETPMKLYKAYEKIFPEDLSRFKLI